MKTRKVLKLGRGEEKGTIVEEEAPHENVEDQKSRVMQVVSMASELGFAISLPIAGGAFLGQLLDAKLHSTPRMTLSFIFFGVFLAGANIYFIIRETKEH